MKKVECPHMRCLSPLVPLSVAPVGQCSDSTHLCLLAESPNGIEKCTAPTSALAGAMNFKRMSPLEGAVKPMKNIK
jgi:hypothetical protein